MPRLLCDVISVIAESLVWDERRSRLFWCDIPAGRLHSFCPSTGATWGMQLSPPVGSLGLCRSGRLIVANGWDILLVDPETGATDILARISPPSFRGRLNDGRVGPDGAFWVGSIHAVAFEDMRPVASLYRVTSDGRVREVFGGLKVSNGLAFSRNGSTLFHSDSVQKWVNSHDFDAVSGAVGPAKRFCSPDEAQGRPDGATVDRDGNYWSAGVSAGVLNCYGPSGRMIDRIPLPVPHPTMPCFGGSEYRTLFVASHRVGMSSEDIAAAPWSGGILTVPTEAVGLPEHRFRD
ncbi:SMP-30/gluconolactonase/LRE family protein [Xanthobacteraceae bacterium Astr-EGSB]|uniref:SMP-30/gluconolactonase/LRE family protein n=1 Tax=Astrobacterium formosum TaxID=3069710 RepID=UPI0027AF113A|nr:SMP-30/gluconolactonase/LRE family protein [Xanthobacteraceae bacterium Astr-EGSB]